MSVFDDEIKASSREMLNVMGDQVFVNGVSVVGIINDDQFVDESTGYRRETSISFHVDDVFDLKVGDEILFSDSQYIIRQIPEPNKEDPFFTVEVKRA